MADKRWRLTNPAFMGGAYRSEGYEFVLPEGVAPPTILRWDAAAGKSVDDPIAVEVDELVPPINEPAGSPADLLTDKP